MFIRAEYSVSEIKINNSRDVCYVEKFIFCKILQVIEAYGQTESTAAITCTIAGDNTVGHVGPPTANFMVKLVDVVEKDYSAKDGKGEVGVSLHTLVV